MKNEECRMKNNASQSKGTVVFCHFNTWEKSVSKILGAVDLAPILRQQDRIIIKPNLVENLPPPITTPVELIEAIIYYIRRASPRTEIIIAEGCGSLEYDTYYVFDQLGFTRMASQTGVKLLDLNDEPSIRVKNSRCSRWPEMFLPKIVFENFLISVPVLKAHSLAGVTLTMKNMMGLVPPRFYQQGGCWKKASFHTKIQQAILDLNRYRTPDFTILDATVGMQEAHLWGPTCNPPPNKLAAGFDPVAIDGYGTKLLNIKWQTIEHIRSADGELGCAEPIKLIEIGENG